MSFSEKHSNLVCSKDHTVHKNAWKIVMKNLDLSEKADF